MVGVVEVLIVLKIDIRCSGGSDAYEQSRVLESKCCKQA